MAYVIINGDAREVLKGMEEESVHTCCTSPPYWGLRDYKLEPLVWGGEAGCEHEWGDNQIIRGPAQGQGSTSQRRGRSNVETQKTRGVSQGCWCSLCGAWHGSLGLEPTPELYVQHLVEVFREVRRVLRKDGTLFLNLGDSYAAGGNGGHQKGEYFHGHSRRGGDFAGQAKKAPPGLKPKDLVGVPWRVAFALQADGWWLRMDNVWNKPNPMPSSAQDRTTKAHEYLFHLARNGTQVLWRHDKTRQWIYTKPSPDYVWHDHSNNDAKQTDEPPNWRLDLMPDGKKRWSRINLWAGFDYYYDADAIMEPFADERNGSPGGKKKAERNVGGRTDGYTHPAQDWVAPEGRTGKNHRSVWTIATTPYKEAHFATFPPALVEPMILAGCPPGGIVLDPFCGAGTTLLVAERLGRNGIGVDLSSSYCEMAEKRLKGGK